MLRKSFNKLTPSGRERNTQADTDYENSPIRSPDELLVDDKEILGQHARGLFRDRSRKLADKLEDKISHAEDVKDLVTRREKYLEMRSNFTQLRIDRLQAKIDNSPDNLFSRRLNNWRREKLHDWKAKNKKRSKNIKGAEIERLSKPEELQRKIDKLVKDKIDAMYKKAERVELRKEGIKPRNRIKRAEFVANLSLADKKRIIGQAIRLVRKKNIELGSLDYNYSVDDFSDENSVDIRKVTDDYGRVIN